MIITEMNEGKKIAYTTEGTVLELADGALTMNLARYQRDCEVVKDVMVDGDGNLIIGAGRYYAAEVVVPPAEYEEQPEGETKEETTEEAAHESLKEWVKKPLDMDKVELRLWSVEGIYIG